MQLPLTRVPAEKVRAAVNQLTQTKSRARQDQLMPVAKQAWEAGDAVLKKPPPAAAAGSSTQGTSHSPDHEVTHQLTGSDHQISKYIAVRFSVSDLNVPCSALGASSLRPPAVRMPSDSAIRR